jgi:hypothetical protein
MTHPPCRRTVHELDNFGCSILDCGHDRRAADGTREGGMASRRDILLASIALGLAVGTNPAAAEKKYDPGATDTEIKIGNIMPYSGPLSAYALIGRRRQRFST